MKKFPLFTSILLFFLAFAESAYCQAVCPLNKITPDSKFASALMFYMGNFMILAICAGIIIVGVLFLPKRIRTCPVSKLAKGKKIVLLYGDKKIVIPRDSEEFNGIISNLSDERKQSDVQIASMKMYIYVNSTRYTIQVSMAGWNFLNEERNSRRLVNNLQVMKTIDSLIDKTASPVVK
ncbi:MAG: hypothetical protein WC547_01800 [Candidatus Omnitrophota bacterium]